MKRSLALGAVVLTAPICLAAQDAREAPARVVVVDAATGAPIDGATLTRLPTRPGDAPNEYRVRVRRLGYAPADAVVRADASAPLRVALTPNVVSLDATVVSASRRIQRLADAPVAVRLVTREEVERSGASDLATVLTEQGGLTIDGGTPTGAGVMLQGLDSRRVLVLLDGQPVVGRLNGNLDLSRIPSSVVGRVEVVKGPQSTLYGSDALGGVVNIITRPAPNALGGSLSLTGGTQGRRDAAASVGGALGPGGGVRWLADVGHRTVETTPGRDATLDARSRRWDGAGKVHWQADTSLGVDVSALLLDEQQRWRAGQIFTFGDNRQASVRASAAWTPGATSGRTRLEPIVSLSTYEHLARQALSAAPSSADGQRDVQRLLSAELLGSHRLDAAGRLVVDGGVVARREAARSDRIPNGLRDRSWFEPYAQLTLGGDRWSFVPGARVTSDTRWGTFVTPRVAAMVRPVAPLALRLSAGRGYRAPDFKELYLELLNERFGYVVNGNPELRPEVSENLSGSAEWAGARVYLRADVFANRLHDFIEDVLVGGTNGIAAYSYGNVGRGITRGVGLESVVRLGLLRAEAGYDFLDAYDRDTDLPLLGRPRHSARLTLGTTTARGLAASLGTVYTGVAPVARNGDGTVLERDAFVRVNARVAQSLGTGRAGEWRVEVGADNLLGANPSLWPGFTGRRVYTGLRWSTSRD